MRRGYSLIRRRRWTSSLSDWSLRVSGRRQFHDHWRSDSSAWKYGAEGVTTTVTPKKGAIRAILRAERIQLRHQRLRPVIPHTATLARVGPDLRPVHAHQAHAQQLQLPRQQQHLQKTLGHRVEVLPSELADRVVVRVRVRRDIPRAQTTVTPKKGAIRAINFAMNN